MFENALFDEQVEIISTNVTARYVPYWTLSQAIKEATQNIVYGSLKAGMKPILDYVDGICTMEDKYIGFDKQYLYFGESEQKDDEDGLGNFGEGWKVFMLVCARMNVFHKVETVGFSFYGRMKDTKHNVKALEIVIEDNDRTVGTKVTVKCSKEEFEKGTMSFAVTQNIESEYCTDMNLIPNRNGELFINGVRIENEDTENPLGLHYSYHIKNRELMNRDRSQVNPEKAYDIISDIWANQSDFELIKEYVKKAKNGEIEEDIQRGAKGYNISHLNRRIWKSAIAEVHECREEQLVIPSRNVIIDKECEYRNYVLVALPDKWYSMLSWIDIPFAKEIVKARFSEMSVVDFDDLSDNEKAILKQAKLNTKKALNLNSIKLLPTIKIVDKIVDTHGVTEAIGLWDRESKEVYIRRDQLINARCATRVMIHECLHWKSGAGDNTEWFTKAFEEAILNLLGY